MTDRLLLAYIDRVPVGTLRDANGIWSFQYAPQWLAASGRFAISPHLPLSEAPLLDAASQRPVQWYFDNLLPEESQRTLLAKDARLDSADAFGLLAYYGAESAGSITLLPPDAPIPEDEALRALPDAELNARILALPRVPLTHNARKRMSLAGAQHKLAVVLRGGEILEPGGAMPSTHILKPDHPDEDYPHSVINEWFVMRLAQAVGLEAPGVYRRYVPSPVYLIERFDRIHDGQGWQRLHAIDACQLLGLDRSFKYTEGNMENLASLANACRGKIAARARLFNWLIFNVLVGNTDAHLKNLSFLVGPDGIELAPHYDILSTACYETPAFNKTAWPKQTEMAWPILGKRYISDIDRNALILAADALSINKTTATRQLNKMCDRIIESAGKIYAVFEAENQVFLQDASLAFILNGEARCLRAIIHVVIKDGVERLRQG